LPGTCFKPRSRYFCVCENKVFQSNEKTASSKPHGSWQSPRWSCSCGPSTICFTGGRRCEVAHQQPEPGCAGHRQVGISDLIGQFTHVENESLYSCCP
jgi:hypothetical protein